MYRKYLWIVALIAGLLLANLPLAGAQTKGSNVLASIGKFTITEDDINGFIKAMPESIRSRYSSAEAKKRLLDSIVDTKMFALEAARMGLEKDPQVEKAIQAARDRILSHEYLNRNVLQKTEVKDEEAKKFYEEHKADYNRPAQVKISQILVNSEAEAKKINDELKKGGEFAALAKEKSKDSFAAKGGQVGWIEKSANPTVFEQAAFNLKSGQISDPIKTEKGYYVIKSEGVRPEFKRTFEQAKSSIIARLKMDKQKDSLETIKADLRKRMKVQVNYDLVKGEAPAPIEKGKSAGENPFEKALKQMKEKDPSSGEQNPFIDALKKALEQKSQEK